jgi:hypothetical protein
MDYTLMNYTSPADLLHQEERMMKLLQLKTKLNYAYELSTQSGTAGVQAMLAPPPPDPRDLMYDPQYQQQLARSNLSQIMNPQEINTFLNIASSDEILTANQYFSSIVQMYGGKSKDFVTAQDFLSWLQKYKDVVLKEGEALLGDATEGEKPLEPTSNFIYVNPGGDGKERHLYPDQGGPLAPANCTKGKIPNPPDAHDIDFPYNYTGGKPTKTVIAGWKNIFNAWTANRNYIYKKYIKVQPVAWNKGKNKKSIDSMVPPLDPGNVTFFDKEDLSEKRKARTQFIQHFVDASAPVMNAGQSRAYIDQNKLSWDSLFSQVKFMPIFLFELAGRNNLKTSDWQNFIADFTQRNPKFISSNDTGTIVSINYQGKPVTQAVLNTMPGTTKQTYQEFITKYNIQLPAETSKPAVPVSSATPATSVPTGTENAPASQTGRGFYRHRHVIKVGRGIAPIQEDRWRMFGKYVIHAPSLREHILNIKTKTTSSIDGLPKRNISKHLSHTIRTVLDNNNIDEDVIDSLSPDDKKLFYHICKRAEIMEGGGFSQDEHEEKEFQRFELLKNEIIAGNNSPEVLRELKSKILMFMTSGRLTRKEGYEILAEISLLD